ncbi:MAG: IS110 family transposase [Bacteroidota bacterium]
MKKVIKQVAGIDVAKNELVVSLGRMYDDWMPDLYACKAFANTTAGIEKLIGWVSKLADATVPTRFIMEATGVYHERLAYYLDANGREVSIVLPNKISNYMRTLDTNTVTDKTASQAITRFGLERPLNIWHRPKETYRNMKQLTRERDQLVAERSMLKNFLHAETSEAHPDQSSIARIKERIALLDRQENEIMSEVAALVTKDEEAKTAVELITSIPGVGMLTAAIILAETNGFDLIVSRRQLASYAGFDVKEKQSGTSIKGQPHISKKGNRHLRKAMHLPALSTIRHDENFKAIYARLISKHGIKMKAAVALQRKVLELAFTLYKTKTKYNPEYLNKEKNVKQNELNLA